MRNRENRKQMISWLAVAAWMVVIFLFSAQNDIQSGDTSGTVVRWFLSLIYRGFADFSPEQQQSLLDSWHLVIRKSAHFTEYAILGILIANVIRGYSLRAGFRWLLPIAASALYAVTDEVHQYFVPGRACRFLDVCIDTAGAVFGTALFTLAVFQLTKHKSFNRSEK